MSNTVIELVRDKAINGKPKIRKIKGYDCSHFHWDKLCGIIDSHCDLGKIKFGKKYYKDCNYMNNPRECKYFVCQKRLELIEECENE